MTALLFQDDDVADSDGEDDGPLPNDGEFYDY